MTAIYPVFCKNPECGMMYHAEPGTAAYLERTCNRCAVLREFAKVRQKVVPPGRFSDRHPIGHALLLLGAVVGGFVVLFLGMVAIAK